MPIYEYKCLECDLLFEEFIRSASDEASVVCQRCGSGEVHREFSSFGFASKNSRGEVTSSRMASAGCHGCSTHNCAHCH